MGIINGKWISHEPMLESGEHDCRPALPWMTRFVRPGALWECKCGIRWVARETDSGGKEWRLARRRELSRDDVVQLLRKRGREADALGVGAIEWVLDELAELNLARWDT